MTTKELQYQIDITKDYYGILGVSSSATVEEIKAAHVKLALKYHPDVLKKGTDDSNGLDFKQISEAWSVLSKPDSRVLYDQKRNLNSAQSTVSSRESHDRIGFQVQRKNFENVQRRASSNWSDIQDKYKTEKWRKMTLQEKKFSRLRPVTTMPHMINIFIPMLIMGSIGMSVYYYNHQQSKRKKI